MLSWVRGMGHREVTRAIERGVVLCWLVELAGKCDSKVCQSLSNIHKGLITATALDLENMKEQ